MREQGLQATVAAWGPEGGSVVRDDGTRLPLSADLLASSVFRFLRSGQRVQLQVTDGAVTWLGLPGTSPTTGPQP